MNPTPLPTRPAATPVFAFWASSLRTRILLLGGGTAVAATLFALLAVYVVTRHEERRVVDDSIRITGALTEQLLRDRAEAISGAGAVLATQPTIVGRVMSEANAREDWQTVSGIAETAAEQIGADAIVISDAKGRELGQFPEKGNEKVPASPRSDIRRERGFAETVGSGAGLSGAGKWSGFAVHGGRLYVASRIAMRPPGTPFVSGVLSAYSAIDDPLAVRLADTLRRQLGAEGCEVAFVRGTTVFGSSRKTLPGTLAQSASGGAGQSILLDGMRYVLARHTLSLGSDGGGQGVEPVAVLVLFPYDRAVALPRRLEKSLLLPFALSLLFALIAGAIVARQMTEPLDGVMRAARLLQRGGWPERFATRRTDEIGLLQNVFDDMNDSLQTANERLMALIDIDPLTELDNHRRFQERLEAEVRRASASGEALSLLLLDLDRFHDFNQREGHAAGDEALQQVARIVRQMAPPLAETARFGGEEFAVLLPRHSAGEAAALAEQIADTIRRESAGTLTVSVGYAERRKNEDAAENLALAAEMALAQAKQLGRDRVCGFDALAASGVADPLPIYRFLKDGSLSTIQALAAAVDAKDPYTQGHSRRVAEMASRLARERGLPPSEVDLIYTTGTLHDVGKIGIPDRILQKPGRLDDEERRLMETHPVLGEMIVGKAPQLSETLPGVRGHHERWDGAGYPDGLAGANIPLSARILALADTFDAMTSSRPYRDSLSWETARNEITRQSGRQFDPDLAVAFLAVLERETRSEGSAAAGSEA